MSNLGNKFTITVGILNQLVNNKIPVRTYVRGPDGFHLLNSFTVLQHYAGYFYSSRGWGTHFKFQVADVTSVSFHPDSDENKNSEAILYLNKVIHVMPSNHWGENSSALRKVLDTLVEEEITIHFFLDEEPIGRGSIENIEGGYYNKKRAFKFGMLDVTTVGFFPADLCGPVARISLKNVIPERRVK